MIKRSIILEQFTNKLLDYNEYDQIDISLDLKHGLEALTESLDGFIDAMNHQQIIRGRNDIGVDLATCYTMLHVLAYKFGFQNQMEEMVEGEVKNLEEQYFKDKLTKDDYSTMEF